MALISLMELIDIAIMTLFLGFIFKDIFRFPSYGYRHYSSGFDFENMKFAMIITAPAIILHEFGHKFVAMAFGLSASFHAAYLWLIIGAILKIAKVPIIFFVPAYVSYPATATHFQAAMIAIAGPLVNLLLWISSKVLVKFTKSSRKKTLLLFSAKINMFLFFFNMIPFGFFDGGVFFRNIFSLL